MYTREYSSVLCVTCPCHNFYTCATTLLGCFCSLQKDGTHCSFQLLCHLSYMLIANSDVSLWRYAWYWIQTPWTGRGHLLSCWECLLPLLWHGIVGIDFDHGGLAWAVKSLLKRFWMAGDFSEADQRRSECLHVCKSCYEPSFVSLMFLPCQIDILENSITHAREITIEQLSG